MGENQTLTSDMYQEFQKRVFELYLINVFKPKLKGIYSETGFLKANLM